MVVEATYVLCTSNPTFIDEREARHKDKVKLTYLTKIQNRMIPVFNVIMHRLHQNLK